MKIAVIISGQPRFTNNPNCFASQKQKVFNQGDVDVFAHLWAAKDNNYVSSSWSGMAACPAEKNDIQNFVDKWGYTILCQEFERQFSNPELFAKIKERFPEPHWVESDFNKALSHLYSLEKAITLFEEYQSYKEYDWVVVLRTDVCIWEFPDLSMLKKNHFYYSSIFHPEHFADICFITSPEYISGLKAYSYLMDPSHKIVEKLLKPCGEQFKKEAFIDKFTREPLTQIPLPVRVVRNNESKGNQW